MAPLGIRSSPCFFGGKEIPVDGETRLSVPWSKLGMMKDPKAVIN